VNAKFPVATYDGADEKGGKERVKWVSGIMSPKGKDWNSMETRMGRVRGNTGPNKRSAQT
jgi:hypothetical protein